MIPPLRSLRATFTAALAALAFVASAGFSSTLAFAAPPLAHRELQLPVGADARVGDGKQEPRVEARLLVDLSGSTRRVAVLVNVEPGWHFYWHNPGEVGLATELEWQADDARVGPIEWPTPERFDDRATGLTSYGYEEEVLLSSELQDHSQSSHISAALEFLVCRDECIPMEFSLDRSLSPSAISPEEAERERALIALHRERLPRSAAEIGLELDARYSRTTIRPGDRFEAAIVIRGTGEESPGDLSPASIQDGAFFAGGPFHEALEIETLGITAHPSRSDARLLALRGGLDPEVEGLPTRLSGVLVLRTATGSRSALTLDLPFPGVGATEASEELGAGWIDGAEGASAEDLASGSAATSWLRFLLLAFLGGVLINAMPCVLPVLGIKICSAAELAQHSPGELRRHGFAYAGGVLLSMATLAAVVIALRSAGTRVGWGFQFQEPLFVAIVATVVVLFAMNLFGLFEIQISTGGIDRIGASSQGVARSFFDGLLCVVLATPCTAPFLGTAVGFAFASSAGMTLAVFLSIGAGLAIPYVAICLIPGWSRFVPRPGNWMLRLRTGLGFLLMGTAVWLVWIYGRSAGLDGVVGLLGLLLILAFGSWLLGGIQNLGRPRATLTGAALLLALSIGGLDMIDGARASAADSAPDAGAWAPYDAQAIHRALEQTQPVFVSFTADWCITCKVNERVVLADSRVREAMDELGFATFRGDWTHRDEAIRSELARHGRAGVPLYLVYDPSDPNHPRVLPELLTVDGLLASLRLASRVPSTPAVTLAQGDLGASVGH